MPKHKIREFPSQLLILDRMLRYLIRLLLSLANPARFRRRESIKAIILIEAEEIATVQTAASDSELKCMFESFFSFQARDAQAWAVITGPDRIAIPIAEDAPAGARILGLLNRNLVSALASVLVSSGVC
jgi:hypothetical protein